MFVSGYFLVFLGITIACFFGTKKSWRPTVLLLASYLFCGAISFQSLVVLVGITCITYMAALKIEGDLENGKRRSARGFLVAAVIVCILLLAVYKYIPHVLQHFGLTEELSAGLIQFLVMPVGLSFYLFQAISYMVDVYRQKYRAEKKFIHLALFFAFFAKFVSGPIERGDKLLPQLEWLKEVRLGNRGRLSTAFTYMLWGYFMKMVVADRLAVTVSAIFDGAQFYDSFWLFIGALFYTIQIYCDFAGYSYIAIGCARIFGIHLTHNFETPYCARNITEFWRCWHISLSSWLKEYLYIPLGGNRKGELRKYGNLMIVFVICGIWHGVGLNFVAWGLLHGIYSVVNHVWRKHHKQTENRIYAVFSWGMTFFSVMIAWIFFRASGLETALLYVWRMLTAGINIGEIDTMAAQLNLDGIEITVITVGIIVVAVMDYICCRKQIHLPELIQHNGNAVRYLIFYLLIIAIFVFGMYGPGYHAEQFIYMQF